MMKDDIQSISKSALDFSALLLFFLVESSGFTADLL